MTPEEIKALQEQNKKLRADAEALAANNESLKADLETAKADSKPEAVKGSFTAKWDSPKDGAQSRKVEFVDGHKNLRVGDKLVATELVLAIANGKKEDAPDWLTKEVAADHLTKLAQIDYGYLKPVKAKS